MKALVLVFTLLTTFSSLAQDSDEQRAREFIKLLVDEKFEKASEQFSPQVAAKITPVQLGSIWQTINSQTGKMEEIVSTDVRQQGGMISTTLLCKFEKAYLNISLTYDSKEQLAGLFFKPAEAPVADAYQSADYVNKDLFGTEEMHLKSPAGELRAIYTAPLDINDPPVVVLVHGSGPNDADETLGPNKLFVDLAEGLASKGIATLRYDKRTKAYPKAFTENATVDDEVTEDAVNALTMAGNLSKGNIFVLGHSLGGMMAPRIAQESENVDGVIILAGNSRPLDVLLVDQVDYLIRNGAVTPDDQSYIAIKQAGLKLQKKDFDENTPKSDLMNIHPGYWTDLLSYDQVKTARKLKVPVLVMQGERDYQVTMEDFEGWKKALKKKATFQSYPALNHMFFEGEGILLPIEYTKKGNVPEYVINDLSGWVRSVDN